MSDTEALRAAEIIRSQWQLSMRWRLYWRERYGTIYVHLGSA